MLKVDKKMVYITEGFMLISLCALLIVFQHEFQIWTVVLKSLTSVFFVLTGFIGYSLTDEKSRFSKLMLAALFCSMIGDVLLALDKNEGILFVLGVVSFATAHIMFSVAFSSMMPVCKKDIAGAVIIFVILTLILCFGPFDYKGLFPVLLGYASIISFMVTKAIRLWGKRSVNKRGITAISFGGVLFLVSDIVLLFWLFGIDMPLSVQSVNWVLYYTAQGFLSYSLSEAK